MTTKAPKNYPPLWQQGIPVSIFATGMIAANLRENPIGALIASDGLSATLRNIMRSMPTEKEKGLFLRSSVLAIYAADRLLQLITTKSGILIPSICGCAFKIFSDTLNAFLNGKVTNSDGVKVRSPRSNSVLFGAVFTAAACVFLLNKSTTNVVLLDGAVTVLSTTIKNATKQYPRIYSLNMLIGISLIASLWDLNYSNSLLTKNTATGISLGLLCKNGIRIIEESITGTNEEDDEDCLNDSPAISIPSMEGRILSTATAFFTGILLEQDPHQIPPVLGSCSFKLGSRIFNNILRHYSFEKSLSITAIASGVCLLAGESLKMHNPITSKALTSLGLSIPFEELKTWQLDKKIKIKKTAKEKQRKTLTV
jgi:hypothetical protein